MTGIVSLRKRRKILTVVVIVVVVLSLPEFAARLYRVLYQLPTYVTRRDFLLSRPAPFKDAEYWSPEFIDESLDISYWDYFTKKYPSPADRSGRWVNYRNGSRITTNQPSVWQHTIWMFGSSGLYGFGVPDEDTIPSDLQALYNKFPGNYRVMDMGMSAAIAQQELARLQTIPLNPGDIVVFYDGTVTWKALL